MKTVDFFLETIAICDMKVGRSMQTTKWVYKGMCVLELIVIS